MRMKLTADAVAALRLGSENDDLLAWDTELTGFGYRLRRASDGRLLRGWVVGWRRGKLTPPLAHRFGLCAQRSASKSPVPRNSWPGSLWTAIRKRNAASASPARWRLRKWRAGFDS